MEEVDDVARGGVRQANCLHAPIASAVDRPRCCSKVLEGRTSLRCHPQSRYLFLTLVAPPHGTTRNHTKPHAQGRNTQRAQSKPKFEHHRTLCSCFPPLARRLTNPCLLLTHYVVYLILLHRQSPQSLDGCPLLSPVVASCMFAYRLAVVDGVVCGCVCWWR
jgi:hypothetical protein